MRLLSTLFILFLCSSLHAHELGEYYQGGIIFWLDKSKEHGLIAAPYDAEKSISWSTREYPTDAKDDGILAGKINSEKINNAFGPHRYAASVASKYNEGGYTDWYLPSKYELNLVFQMRKVIGGFEECNSLNCVYSWWSSTEADTAKAWYQVFSVGSSSNNTNVGGQFIANGFAKIHVRPIRSF